MTSNRPYLIRAFFDWIVDNGLTPHLLVDAEFPNTLVPTEFVDDGQIVLNISPTAVQDLQIGNYLVCFNARFSGKPFAISLPPDAVLGIYAKENGHGMLFEAANHSPEAIEPEGNEPPPTPKGPPTLKVIK